jgi:perosamine synthetase
VLAAIGCAQMEQLDSYLEKKLSIARRYDQAFQDVPGITAHVEAPWAESIHWLYTILIERDAFGAGSRDVLAALEKEKIQTRPLWTPMDQLPPFAACDKVSIVVSPRLHQDALSLPCSVGLTDGEATRVIESVKAVHDRVTSAAR